jgi:hypothetical protein
MECRQVTKKYIRKRITTYYRTLSGLLLTGAYIYLLKNSSIIFLHLFEIISHPPPYSNFLSLFPSPYVRYHSYL